jgi:hypothetical protein
MILISHQNPSRLREIKICCEKFFIEINNHNYIIRFKQIHQDIINVHDVDDRPVKFCPYCGAKIEFRTIEV